MGTDKKHHTEIANTLRSRAEQRLSVTRESIVGMPTEHVQKLVHELQVHQIELQMQNEQLQATQLELETARDRYRDLYDSAPVGYLTLDADGSILEANLTATLLLGMDRNQLIDQSFYKLFHRDYRDTIYLHLQEVFRSNDRHTCDVRMAVSADDKIKYMRLETVVVQTNHPISKHCRTTLSDVTEQWRDTKNLKIDGSRLSTLLMLSELNDNGQTDIAALALAHAVRLTGSRLGFLGFLNEQETVFTDHTWTNNGNRFPNDQQKPIEFSVDHAGLWGEPVRQRNSVIINNEADVGSAPPASPLGQIKLSSFLGVPVFDGKMIVAVAAVGNKSDKYDLGDSRQLTLLMNGVWQRIKRQQAEIDLRRYRDHLEQQVVERTRALEESRRHASRVERLASIGTLAAGIAHEINNPLGIISLCADDAVGAIDDQRYVIDSLCKIKYQVRRCGSIVKNVLQFARGQTTEKTSVDLNQIIKRSADFATEYARTHGVYLIFKLDQSRIPIQGNTTELEQVFVNLIHNAVQACEGKGSVIISTSMTDIQVRVSVHNNGKAMSHDDMKHVFDPFFTTRLAMGGTGLGLSIVHGIVTDHGGTIDITSDADHGTTFAITLSRHPE